MLKETNISKSVQGLPLKVVHFLGSPPTDKSILFLGGVHGNEVEGVWLLEAAIENWGVEPFSKSLNAVVFPRVNPDGIERGERLNASGVDLNRNLPSQDWTAEIQNPKYPPGPAGASEPETQALTKLIRELNPLAILSVHSFSNFQININGPSRDWGMRLASVCGYPITEDIGYPTPGCLGTYSGRELGIPTITLEIERGMAKNQVIERFIPVLEATMAFWEEKETR